MKTFDTPAIEPEPAAPRNPSLTLRLGSWPLGAAVQRLVLVCVDHLGDSAVVQPVAGGNDP